MDDLIARLKRKEDSALKEVMRMYKNQVFNYLHLLVGNAQAAEELTQDTFVRVYFKAPGLRTNNLKSWIYTIATNLARSEFRKQRLRRWLHLSEAGPEATSCPSQAESSLLLEQLLAALPEKFRTPLVMKEMDNFSFEEIARMLGKPVGTVKSLVFRGKDYLKTRVSVPGGDSHA